eukprot:11172848-Lingulodinium_polyedra.AAC.1
MSQCAAAAFFSPESGCRKYMMEHRAPTIDRDFPDCFATKQTDLTPDLGGHPKNAAGVQLVQETSISVPANYHH